jgi:hypothetical protein
LADLPKTLREKLKEYERKKSVGWNPHLPSISAGLKEYQMMTDGVEPLEIDGVEVVHSFYVTSRETGTDDEYKVALEWPSDLELLDGINGRFLTIRRNTVYDMDRKCGALVENMAVLPHRNFAVEFKDESDLIYVHTDDDKPLTISREMSADGTSSEQFRSQEMRQSNLHQLYDQRILIILPRKSPLIGEDLPVSSHKNNPGGDLRIKLDNSDWVVFSEVDKSLSSEEVYSEVRGNEQLLQKIREFRKKENKPLSIMDYVGDFALVTKKQGDKLVHYIVKLKNN